MLLNKAIEIAAKAHAGQVDKGGHPYILHPLRVMLNCQGEAAQICGILHDVIEDTEITPEFLLNEGFGPEIIEALDCLTKRDGESYDAFIGRVLANKIACHVKLADLSDNMNLARIANPSEKDRARIEKYKAAANRISEALPYAEEIPNARLVEINGVVEMPPYISSDQFTDMFIAFIESHGWFFGGGLSDVTDKRE